MANKPFFHTTVSQCSSLQSRQDASRLNTKKQQCWQKEKQAWKRLLYFWVFSLLAPWMKGWSKARICRQACCKIGFSSSFCFAFIVKGEKKKKEECWIKQSKPSFVVLIILFCAKKKRWLIFSQTFFQIFNSFAFNMFYSYKQY